jgi:hypothetical protein
MTLRHMKAAFAAVWLLGVFVYFFRAAELPSMFNGIVIAAVAILPPLVLWFWWNDPSPTMSESIQEARNGPVRRP